MITPDEWEAWRTHPVTEAVMAAHIATAEANKAAWIEDSWGMGPLDVAVRDRLFVRADCYRAIAEMTHADLCKMMETDR